MTYATVPELSVNELRILIREVVEETIVDLVVERGCLAFLRVH